MCTNTLRTNLEPVHFGSEFEPEVFWVAEKKTAIIHESKFLVLSRKIFYFTVVFISTFSPLFLKHQFFIFNFSCLFFVPKRKIIQATNFI